VEGYSSFAPLGATASVVIGRNIGIKSRLRLVHSLAWTAAVILVLAIGRGWAVEDTTPRREQPIAFSIPAQPLVSALQLYGQIAGVQVLYESRSAAGRQSTAVDGLYAPRDALALLLTGTDLRARYSRPDAVTLAPDDPETPRGQSLLSGASLSLGTLHVHGNLGAVPPISEYSEQVRRDIENALQHNAQTRVGNYRAALNVWINTARMVERVDVANSSGDPARDAALISTLRGVTIGSAAPLNAPRPVRVSVAVRTM
jgi:hypothetical protein